MPGDQLRRSGDDAATAAGGASCDDGGECGEIGNGGDGDGGCGRGFVIQRVKTPAPPRPPALDLVWFLHT
jgi:hypothetical protein